jgi:curved DNA-binding protein CbpA
MPPNSSSGLNPADVDELHRLQEMAQSKSHYKVLGISSRSKQEDIQEAFYELSRKWHPDRFFRRDLGPQTKIIEEVFVAITEAYRTLSDQELRLAHDRKLREDERKQEENGAGEQGANQEVRLQRKGGRKVVDSSRAALRERAAARKKKRTMQRARQLSPSMSRVREQMIAQLQKARKYYRSGKEAYDQGNMVKASSSLQLAVSYDPDNETYRKLFEEVKLLAKQSIVRNYIAAAENAESFQNPREALANYRKAIEAGTDQAAPHYRLAVMMQVYEDDPKGALVHLRDAVKLAPNNLDYRIALGKLYIELGHALNAKREFQYVLHKEKGHAEAKSLLKKLR